MNFSSQMRLVDFVRVQSHVAGVASHWLRLKKIQSGLSMVVADVAMYFEYISEKGVTRPLCLVESHIR